MKARRHHFGWAITTGLGGFIGRYWHFGTPPAESAYLVAMFATRREARRATTYVKPPGRFHAYPGAKVVKVAVTVEECSP